MITSPSAMSSIFFPFFRKRPALPVAALGGKLTRAALFTPFRDAMRWVGAARALFAPPFDGRFTAFQNPFSGVAVGGGRCGAAPSKSFWALRLTHFHRLGTTARLRTRRPGYLLRMPRVRQSLVPCLAGLIIALAGATPVRGDPPPGWLTVRVCEDVTWTNRGPAPVKEIVFNAHSAYEIPEKDIGLLAKMLEILRMSPTEAMSPDGPALRMEEASVPVIAGKELQLVEKRDPGRATFSFDPENQTALIVPLPEPLEPGQSATVRLNFTMKLPPKKGRWGQWDGITTLAQWLPVVAVHDGKAWQPAPFIPWHQPFHNEAGVYNRRVTLPAEQKLAASAGGK